MSYKHVHVKLNGCGKFVILYGEHIWIYTRFDCFDSFITKSSIIILWKKILKIIFHVECCTHRIGQIFTTLHLCRWSVVKANLDLHNIMILNYRNFTNCNLILLILGMMNLFMDLHQNILLRSMYLVPPTLQMVFIGPRGHVYFSKRIRKYKIMFER